MLGKQSENENESEGGKEIVEITTDLPSSY